MQTTNIVWATYSYNPVTGCSKIGPECTNCYAERFSRRQGRTDAPWTHDNADENVTVHPDRLEEPFDYHWPAGHGRVFVGSMTDLFHREVPESFIRRVVAIIRQFPEHVWILLTKRPGRAAALDVAWPENVWLGTSVGSGPGGDYPDTTHRIDQLRRVDAATRWVSFEPLIEPVGDVDLSGIDWAVVGGETAPQADRRPMDHAWARSLLRQCRAQDVAFLFKQDSGRVQESATHLSVEADGGYVVQREIREYPALPAVTKRARQAAVAGGEPDV